MLKKLLLTLTALFAFFAFFTPVSAIGVNDIIMTISPSEQVIELTPGAQYSGSVKVKNSGQLGFTFSLSVAPYHVNDDNYDPDFSTDNSYTNLKNWVTFPQAEYYIEPGQSIDAKFDVDVPTDAPNGGQYAAIMISTRDGIDPSDTLQIIPQGAAILYGHVLGGELREEATLTHHVMSGIMIGRTDFAASATIKNSGNVDFYARQSLTVRNFFTGAEVLPQNPSETPFTSTMIVLPNTSRTNIIKWDATKSSNSPTFGLFRIQQSIAYLDEEYTFEQIVLLCPIWLAIAILALVVLAILWIIIRIAKRNRAKRQSFVG